MQPYISTRSPSIVKPSITETVQRYGVLLRRGRGKCPFHADRNPSFFVREEKCRFHCFGCGANGDVIDFVRKLENLSFVEALSELDMSVYRRRPPLITPERRRAGEIAARWANKQRQKLNVMLAQRLWARDDADEAGAFDLAERADRALIMLRGFYDALSYVTGVAELLAFRKSIELITSDVEESL